MAIEDIRNYLIAQNIVEGATGWECKLGDEPETPDEVVTIFDSAGLPPIMAFGTEAADVPRARYQIRVRGAAFDYATPRAKIGEIMTALQKTNVTTDLCLMLVDSNPIPLGKDGSNRHILVVNFDSHNTGGF